MAEPARPEQTVIVTREMTAAGVRALAKVDIKSESPDDIVVQIYAEMSKAVVVPDPSPNEPAPFDWNEIATKEATRIVGRPVMIDIKGLEMVLSIETDAGTKSVRRAYRDEQWPDTKTFSHKILVPACRILMQSEVVA